MAEIYNTNVLVAGPANQTGNAFNCTGLVIGFTEVIVNCTAASLVGTITFTTGIDPAPGFPAGFVAGGTGALVNAGVGGYSFNVGTAVLSLSSPAIGRTSVVLRWTNPAKYIVPVYVYTSGGGTFTVQVTGWGFGQGTTP